MNEEPENNRATLHFDGSSRGNPGPATYAYVLDANGETLTGCGKFGVTTNNRAEYAGLIAGLHRAVRENYSNLNVRGDAQVIIRQMTGDYSVKTEELMPYYRLATELASRLKGVSYDWIEREKNTRADELAASAHPPD